MARVDPAAAADGRLARLARAEKALRRSGIAPASPKSDGIKRYIAGLAESILAAHRTGYMTLVIVNRVKRAQDLHAAIERLLRRRKSPPTLALVHSRFPPAEREREMNKLAGGESSDVIVVATQAIEAGVDISAAVMFTELAPWSSLVQRFGRANRYAKLDGGADIHWIDLLGEADSEKAAIDLALPYAAEELRAAQERLASTGRCGSRESSPAGRHRPPAPGDPQEGPRRSLRHGPGSDRLRRRCLPLRPGCGGHRHPNLLARSA